MLKCVMVRGSWRRGRESPLFQEAAEPPGLLTCATNTQAHIVHVHACLQMSAVTTCFATLLVMSDCRDWKIILWGFFYRFIFCPTVLKRQVSPEELQTPGGRFIKKTFTVGLAHTALYSFSVMRMLSH